MRKSPTRHHDCEFNAAPASHYRSSPCSPTVRRGDDSRSNLGPLENRPKTGDSCDNFAVVDRAGPHYSARFFRGWDLLKQDRIPRMDWTAFRSHLAPWVRCFFCESEDTVWIREESPFLPPARPARVTRRVFIAIYRVEDRSIVKIMIQNVL